jgi:amino acid adenylation domain-containing protein
MTAPDRGSIGWALDAAQTRRLQQAAAARGVPLADLLHDLHRKAMAEQGLDGAFQFGHGAGLEPLETHIHALWQALLPGAEWGADEGFFDVGGNSLLVIRLFEKLESSWPGLFTVAQLFAVNTIAGQARWIRERQGEPLPAPPAAAAAGAGAMAPVAIVGFALRLPGARTLDACWRDVAAGADRVGPLPEPRAAEARAMLALLGLPAAEPFGEAGWLDEVFAFDPGRFRLAPADAALVEPEHRLFLETALLALEDAGYGGKALDGARVGTFVGMSSGAVWRDLAGRLAPERAEQAFALNVPSNVATRLSFLHDWRGPAGLVDTACSSALAAVHQACRALANGDCSAALAGGAKLILLPATAHARFAIESSTARTHAFDASADGTGAGEGAVVFLLKTLDQAQADGDAIHAVILGTALNQDGASSGMAAPNPAAQAEVIAAAALAAGVPLASLSYIEAHGTGTHLGDPIEIEGLTRAFGAGRGFAAIGSGKGNYGHLDACAGALGLARAVLCLAHDQAPPQPFFTQPNPRIDFAAAPVQVCRELAALADLGTPRRAGVSSFGLSGINVHAVLEAPPARPARAPGAGWTVVGISAATPALLMDYVADLAAALRARPGCALADLALTLDTGRDALAERLAVWARDREDLLAAWEAILAGQGAARSLTGSVPRGRKLQAPAPVSALADGESGAMAAARAFIEGAALVWPPEQPAGRVHLPPSPLQRITCRPELNAAAPPVTADPLRLGPPFDTPDGVRRAVDVHSPAFWPVAEHRLGGVPTLVGMGLLPLLAEAWAGGPGFQPFAIRDLAWLRPLQAPALKPGSVSLLVAPPGQRCLLGGRGLDGAWRHCAEATLAAAPVPPAPLDLGELEREAGELAPAGPFSADPDGGLQVSARWDCLRAAARKGDTVLARLERPRDPESAGWHGLHPGLLDRAASLVLDRPGLVPAGCREIVVCAPLPAQVLAHAVRRALPDGGVEADVRLCSPDTGAVCLAILGLRFALLAQGQAVEKVPVVLSLPVWTPAPLSQGDAGTGPFLLVGEGALCERILAEAGARVQAVTGSHELSAEVLAAVAAGRAGQILLAPAPGPDLGARVAEALRRLMGAMRQPLRLLAVGQGACPEAASMAALVQVAAREEALLSTQYVEVAERTPVAAMLREFSGFERRCNEPALLDEPGERRVRTFIPLAGNESGPAMVWPDSGCCVVTGGTGGLTLMLAEELANSGRVALALISRHGRPTGGDPESRQRREALDSLAGRGIRVRHWCADVSDREQLAGVLDQVRLELGPITAVLHNAGVPDTGVLVKEDPAGFARATAGKMAGARHLDALTREDPVQAFVLSGSLSGVEAMAGTGAYTAANAFLDAFAGWRRREGRPALAIDWCLIGGMGMAARHQPGLHEALSLNPQGVVRTWGLALASGAGQVVMLYHGRPGAEFPAAPAAPAKAAGSQALEQALAGIWARVLGYPQVEFEDDFYALGGDSISGVEIVQAIVEDLGHPATLTDLLEGGTVNGLAGRLRGRAPAAGAGASAALVPAPAQARYPLGWEQLAVVRAQSEAVVSTAFNLPYFLELPPECDSGRLEAALGRLVERHEILRTRFHLDGVEPEMEILAPVLRLPRIHPPGGFTEDFRRAWVRPFDLEAGPPVRFELAVRADGTPEALLFDLHHSLADGLSIERLVAELAALYAGSSLPPQPLQFKDYAWWSRRGAGAEAMDQAKAYWLERYALPLPMMDLPADRSRPVVHDGHCGLAEFALPRSTVDALRRFASARRTTPFTVVLAAWAALLARYARTDDLVIAVPIDARDRVGLPGLPGMMVAVLPLRFTFSPDEPVGGYLDRVQAEVKEAMLQRACPLGTLLEALEPPAAPERALLSEVRLSYMNYAGNETAEAGTEDGFRLVGINRADTKSDLSIFVRDLPGAITVVVEYYAALFDPERIERMGGHFATLLTAMVEAGPDAPLARLALLPDAERAWLESAGRGDARPLPDQASLFGLFTAQVAARGAAPAVCDDGESLSYDGLWYRAGGIARALIAAGVRPGDRVAQHVERSCAAVATMLGIHAAGAAYLPLDPAWPPQRVAWMLQDAGCRVVVADASGRQALAEAGLAATVLAVEDLGPGCAPPALERAPEALAYLMYTSGSTGEPKGVRVLDRGILRLVVQEDYAGLGPDDRLLQAAPLAFDAATFEIWGALLNGAQLWVAGGDEVLDPAALAAILERRGISVLWLTTGLFNRQVEAFPACFQGIRIVLTGGETASPSHLGQAMAACPATEFRNCYGPTENTTFTTTHRLTRSDLDAEAIPIGRPVPHTTVRVLDRAGQLVPMGVWGELVTGGDGVADGYWNRPDLTAVSFLPGPEGASYRTGDLGRWRADGALEFGGRMDGQIKLRGFRIELGEIEQALSLHPAVTGAAVLFRRDPGELIACVTAGAAPPQAAELRAWLLGSLPPSMVPARFIQVARLPITANGKLDRARLDLEAASGQPLAEAAAGGPPETVAERLVAGVFAELFGDPVLDRGTSFLDLGGHSLIIIRAINRIDQLCGHRLTVRDFFTDPTVAGLAAHIQGRRREAAGAGIPRATGTDSLLASHAEERLFLVHGLDPTGSAFTMTFAFVAGRELAPEALRRALSELMARHESLRTGFEERDGQLFRRIEPAGRVPLAWAEDDLSRLADPQAEALRLVRWEVAQPFDLGRPPLLRARLLKLGADATLILIVTHHIVHDGWSSRVFTRELGLAYQAATQGRDPELPALPIRYSDYAAWQRGQDWSEDAAWWRRTLEHAPDRIKLPGDRPPPEVPSNRGETIRKQLPPAVAQGLRALAHRRGVSMAALGLALFSALLYRLTRQADMVIGMGVAGRDQAELEGLIGFFVNILPIRVRLDETAEFDAILAQVHDSLMGALERRHYPFDCLVRDLAPRRSGNLQPLVNVVFEYHRFDSEPSTDPFPAPAWEPGEAFGRALDACIHPPTAKHDLLVFYEDREDRADLVLEYNTDLLTAATAERWLSYLVQFAASAGLCP